jgi:hypothetical protein
MVCQLLTSSVPFANQAASTSVCVVPVLAESGNNDGIYSKANVIST